MRKLIMLMVVMVFTAAASAQELNSKFAIVKGSNVNLRESPSRTGKVITQLSHPETLPVLDISADWVKVSYDYGGDEWVGFISAPLVEVLVQSPLSKEVLTGGFEFCSDKENFGYLGLIPNGDKVDYDFNIKNKEMRAAGGSGTVDWGTGQVEFSDGVLGQPQSYKEETDFTVINAIYDAKKKILFFNGYLWTAE